MCGEVGEGERLRAPVIKSARGRERLGRCKGGCWADVQSCTRASQGCRRMIGLMAATPEDKHIHPPAEVNLGRILDELEENSAQREARDWLPGSGSKASAKHVRHCRVFQNRHRALLSPHSRTRRRYAFSLSSSCQACASEYRPRRLCAGPGCHCALSVPCCQAGESCEMALSGMWFDF